MKTIVGQNTMNFIRDKYFIFAVFIVLLLYILSFLEIKHSFINSSFEYMNYYISYYVNKYLGGNFELFATQNGGNIFIEDSTYSILSSHYIYKITHFTKSFGILTLITPFIIFSLVQRNNHDLFSGSMFYTITTRISQRVFIVKKFLSDYISILLITVLPRIGLFLFYSMSYVNSYSKTHNLDMTILSFQIPSFSEIGINATTGIIYDILILSLYSLIMLSLSYIFNSITKRKGMNLLFYIICLICMYFLYEALAFSNSNGILYMPNIFSQFSYYLFFESFSTKSSYVFVLYQFILIFLLIYVLSEIVKKKYVIN